jgi:hypothetical protein
MAKSKQLKDAQELFSPWGGEVIEGEFVNEHGEVFKLYSNGISVFMAGDEVKQMVDDRKKFRGKYIGLFNNDFNIWSAGELYLLGKTLMEMHESRTDE